PRRDGVAHEYSRRCSCRCRVQTQLAQHLARRPVEARLPHVAPVAKILSALRGRVKAARGQVAEAGKELRGMRKARLSIGYAADILENGVLLTVGEVSEALRKAPGSVGVDPPQTLEQRRAVVALTWIRSADPFIQKIDDAHRRRARRMRVARDDEVA